MGLFKRCYSCTVLLLALLTSTGWPQSPGVLSCVDDTAGQQYSVFALVNLLLHVHEAICSPGLTTEKNLHLLPLTCRFALYNVVGALIWTVLFLGAGFFFGNLPVVQHNFTLVVLGIVAVSVLPVILEVLAARKEQGHTGGGAAGGAAA